MSNWNASLRRMEAARKRQQRESLQHQKELERRLKEQAKLSAIEKARLEVEANENALEVLLSVHKQQSEAFDWGAYATALPPLEPPRLSRHETAVMLRKAVACAVPSIEEGRPTADEAHALDEAEYKAACAEYQKDFAEWERMRSLAKRVIEGEAKAYSEAVAQCSSLSEIANLGSSISITVHDSKLIACSLKVNGRECIPTEMKTLSASEKVSVKAMPKARFHEIYQDYVCACVLRLARELFALLPIQTILLTAKVDGKDSHTGRPAELPVLSVAIPRAIAAGLDFDHLDPSDSLMNFTHRGDVIASRKSGEFVSISPLTPSDIVIGKRDNENLTTLISKVRQLRTELAAAFKVSTPVNCDQTEPETPSE